MSSLCVVLGNSSLARYPQGGGHWTVRLQYLLGWKALGYRAFLLETLRSSGNDQQDQILIAAFFQRLETYDLKEQSILLLFDKDSKEWSFESAIAYGKSKQQVLEIIQCADILFNDCLGIQQPLLGMFRNRALIDLDPGLLQVSASEMSKDLYDHQTYLSVGKKMNDPDCLVPTLGLQWYTYTPFVYLPMWKEMPDPGPNAPFSSITHWGYGSVRWQNRTISSSKRKAYLNYKELPQKAGRPFEIAANLHRDGPDADTTGDRELLESHGWKLTNPWKVAESPLAYQNYIAGSRAEISCPRPIFSELNTGWFSDRSVCYLASGRPVLAEDTGFSDYLPVGSGLIAFRDLSQAVAGVAEIDANYPRHMRAARKLAEEYFDSQKILSNLTEYCAGNM